MSFGSKIIILDKAIGSIIEIFLSTFLAAYFYKITQDNMIYISIYQIIAWIVATMGAMVLGDCIKRKNKVGVYRFGTFIKAFYILLIIILKERILDYVWLIGIFYGISVATTGFPFNMMESELVSEKERTKYMGYKSAIGEITKILVPILLGAYITFTSYEIAAGLVLVFSVIKLVISCFIKNVNVGTHPLDLKKLKEAINQHPQYPIKKLYLIEFLKGITVHGVLDIVLSLLIIYQVKTELNLGMWSSFFSICMILTMFVFARRYNKRNSKKTLTICAISIIISFVLVLCSINMTTIILYNLVYFIFIKILLSITEIRLFDYSNKPPFGKELNTEYFIFREIFLNIGRVLGYGILLIIGFSHNLEVLKVLFLCATIALLFIIKISRDIARKEQETVNN